MKKLITLVLILICAVCYSQPDSTIIVFDRDGNMIKKEFYSTKHKNINMSDSIETTMSRPWRLVDLTGQRFGRLLVVGFAYRKNKATYFKCICDCGKEHITRSRSLKDGSTLSCGCFSVDFHKAKMTKHGMQNSRIYSIWMNMIHRCEYINCEGYKYYGALGITVCERWHKFEDFYNDTKEGYADNLTLDRYPNKSGNYEPSNFRWATKKQQGRNTKSNVYLEYNGEKLTYAEWSERLGFKSTLITQRVRRGWDVEKILTEPAKPNGK